MLNHVVETSHLAAVVAAEIGGDVQIAKMGGLLHDIGKAVDHEVEGPHAAIGAQIAQRHNLPFKVINAIAAHHQEVEYACLEAPIVQIADAISASRPGARGETMDTYVKRLEDLQAIAEASRASSARSPSRPAARCGSSSGPRRSTTSPRPALRATSCARSRSSSRTRPDQGDRHPRDPRGRVRQVATMSRLAGKSAVITGAAEGIGRATADLFATEGARLVATDIDAAGLDQLRADLDSRGAECATVVGDVSKPDDARRMIEAAVEHYGRLDILVANAGIIPLRTITEATPADWDEVMSIDGRGMFLTCKYAIEQMLQNGGGSIVCLRRSPGWPASRASRRTARAKFVASGLTKHLAVEWAESRHPRQRGCARHDPDRTRPASFPMNPAAPSTSSRSCGCTRWAGLGEPDEVAREIVFLRPTTKRSSPVQSCPSTAVTWLADRSVTRLGCDEACLRRRCIARPRSSVGCRT